jgi:hypothetical protein
MFTVGGQQFQNAYANIEKAIGCTTSAAACGANVPAPFLDKAQTIPNPAYGNFINSISSQPFFQAAMNPNYCSGTFSNGSGAYANCTAAVIDNELGNFEGQNVWDLWSDLDQGSNGVAPFAGCNPANTPSSAAGSCGFNFAATMMNSPGAGGAPTCTTVANGSPVCPGAMLSSGVGLNASVGYGNYHAGFVSWRMSNWHGFTSQSNLTWGKALGTGAVYQASSEYTADDPFDISRMYGVQNFDRKLVFNSFFVYEPPFFKGQQGILGRLLGGWNISPLFSAASGVPVYCTATLGGTESEAFGAGDGVNFFDNEQCFPTGPLPRAGRYQGVVGSGGVADQTNPDVTGQFNAFKDPVAVFNNLRPAILGFDNGHDSGQGLFRGLPIWNLDLSVKKNIKLTERFSTVFGAVFTNVLNHDQFTNPSIDLSNTGCLGVLSAACSGSPQANTPRQVELSLRINF